MDDILTLFAHSIIAKGKLGYLLNLKQNSPRGKGKAKFFNAKGFSLPQSEQLANALQQHPFTARPLPQEQGKWGQKLKFRCDIKTPSGASVCIVSVWQIDNGKTIPRLITARPAK